MKFINDHVKLPRPGRKAPRISKDELRHKLLEFGEKHELDIVDDGALIDDMTYLAEEILFSRLVDKDLKFANEPENISAEMCETFGNNIGTPLLGLQTLPNGFTFLGVEGGADWGEPMFYVMYWDGKTIRVYIPTYGNMVNLDTKTAFGLESEGDVDLDNLINKYRKLGLFTRSCEDVYFDIDSQEWMDMYAKRYGLDSTNFAFCWEAIQEDIMSRIIVI